ncbi:MAG: hypothetical protein MO853_01200 [Candidatus Protistobacter heckmanni]|nr:hypothetical protein [Candidatus Protistobacter heckmanni]
MVFFVGIVAKKMLLG